MRANSPLASAKVFARWLCKGDTTVLAMIAEDNYAHDSGHVEAALYGLREYAYVFPPTTSLPQKRPMCHP